MSPTSPSRDPRNDPSAARPEPSFEDRMQRLEAVVHELEGEDLPLETSIQRYREGVEHLKACRALLDEAEKRLVELVAETGPEGETKIQERPLKVTERGLQAADEGEPRGPR